VFDSKGLRALYHSPLNLLCRALVVKELSIKHIMPFVGPRSLSFIYIGGCYRTFSQIFI